jgi:hypothetical protein
VKRSATKNLTRASHAQNILTYDTEASSVQALGEIASVIPSEAKRNEESHRTKGITTNRRLKISI